MSVAPIESARSRRHTNDPDLGLQPPANPQLEAAMLGAILTHTPALDYAAEHLPCEVFYRYAHRELYEVILDLHTNGLPVTPTTVQAAAVHAGIGDRDPMLPGLLITEVIDQAWTDGTHEYLGGQLTLLDRGRAYLDELTRSLALARDPAADHAALFADLTARLEPVIAPPADTVAGGVTLVERLNTATEEAGIQAPAQWGLRRLDRLTRGLRAGLHVIAGGTGGGKTSLALQAAGTTAAFGRRVRVVSYEMTADEIAARIIAQRQQIDEGKVLGEIPCTLEDNRRIARGHAELAQLRLEVDDDATLTIGQIAAKVIAAHRRDPFSLLVIDQAQLIEPSKRRRDGTREQELSEIVRSCKLLSARLRIPVILPSQLNENDLGRRPTLASLRDTRALGHHANTVTFIHRERPEDDRVELIVAKSRRGKPGRIENVQWRGSCVTFADE